MIAFRKKSQIKMMETISVLIVFLILMVFVLIFYIGMSRSTGEEAQDEKSNLRAITISQFASFMPEFQCSSKNIIEENCFDTLKMEAFIDYTTKDQVGKRAVNTTYYDIFKYSRLVAYEVYPEAKVWQLYDHKPVQKRYEEKQSHIPVTFYDTNKNKYSFGMLNVTVYNPK